MALGSCQDDGSEVTGKSRAKPKSKCPEKEVNRKGLMTCSDSQEDRERGLSLIHI